MLTISKEVDTRFLNPAQPILRTLRALQELKIGQILKLTTTDRNAVRNMETLCRQTGQTLMQYMEWGSEKTFLIRKCH